MSTAAFQCPDSGLLVVVSSDGTARGDADDWLTMDADGEAIAATCRWIAGFNRALRQAIAARGRTIEAFEDALRHCGGVVSDLDPLTWERGALECEHGAGTRGGVCELCGGEL
jgi:hypothetical protein